MPCSFRLNRSGILGIGDQDANLGDGCQFGVPEEDLYGAGQNRYCSFHLPRDHEEKSRIDPDLFNEQIFRFVNTARNEGRIVDLSGVHFPGAISFDGYAEQNSLPGVLFARAQFGGDASFRGTDFSGAAIFLSAQFYGRPDFLEATFDDVAIFSQATFYRGASFLRSESGAGPNFATQSGTTTSNSIKRRLTNALSSLLSDFTVSPSSVRPYFAAKQYSSAQHSVARQISPM